MSATENKEQSDSADWKKSLLIVIFRIILYMPVIWIGLFTLFVLLTAVQVGHFPSYGQPDPKESGAISILYMPVMVLLLITMAFTPFGFALAIAKLWQDFPRSIRRWEAILYLVGIALFLLFISSDAAGLMTWLAD